MDLVDGVKTALQEAVLPGLAIIRAENGEIRARLELTNKRIDRLSEVVVRRDEHAGLAQRVERLEKDLTELRSRLAA